MKFVSLTIVFVFFIALLSTAGVGFFLSPQDGLEKADAAVVISGGDTSKRVEKGMELYLGDWVKKLIFSGAAREGTPNAWAMRQQALQADIPDGAILVEPEAQDTFENAKFVAEIIKQQGISSIILITSPYHQRRASLVFEHVLKPLGVEVLNYPAEDSRWRKSGWWKTAWGRKITLEELKKVFYTRLLLATSDWPEIGEGAEN